MKKNKLGVAYNLFTGIELLEHSIKCIRNSVDYICVVYSFTSHRNQHLDYSFMPILERLLKLKLIDEIVEFRTNNNVSAKQNEISQRNTGLEMCKHNNCEYFMTMDVDEMYITSEFDKAKDYVIANNYDSSACQMLSYYKYDNIIIDPPETYYVPFIYKINEHDLFGVKPFPVLVDNTRIYTVGNNIIFKRNELQMHHFTYVRESIREKLYHSCILADEEKIKKIETHYKNFNPYVETSKILTYNGFFNFKTIDSSFKIKLNYAKRKTV